MAQSLRFRKLERRLTELRRHLLPKVFSPTGNYSIRQIDMAMGYRLLCHAEIEDFIESVSRNVVLEKVNLSKTGKATLTTLTLLAYYKVSWDGLLDTENDEASVQKLDSSNPFSQPLSKLLDLAAHDYFGRIVTNNHGIRTDNLKRLLKPTGLDFDSLDQTWLTTIDEFGKQRGATAHTSSVGVSRQIDPKGEFDRIELLKKGLGDLDDALGMILKSKN